MGNCIFDTRKVKISVLVWKFDTVASEEIGLRKFGPLILVITVVITTPYIKPSYRSVGVYPNRICIVSLSYPNVGASTEFFFV